MTWVEIIRRVKRRMQQADTKPIDNETYKIYGTDRQIAMAEVAPLMFEVRRTITLAKGKAEYELAAFGGRDLLEIYRVVFDGEREIYPIKQGNIAYPLQSGTPSQFYIRDGGPRKSASISGGKIIGFISTPDSIKTVCLFGFRAPPRWVLSLHHLGTADATGATYNIKEDNSTAATKMLLTLTIEGGANAGSDEKDLLTGGAAGAEMLLSEVAAWVKALGKGFTMLTGVDVNASLENATQLENTEATPGVPESPSVLNTTKYLYLGPEVPRHAERCLAEGMMADACADVGMDNRSQLHEARFEKMLRERKSYTKSQARGTGIEAITDVYSDGISPELRLPGGWIVP